MEYTPFIDNEKMAKRGYNLLAPGKLELGTFSTPEEACADFLQECFDTIYNLIEKRNGAAWTDEFFEDMKLSYDKNEKPRGYQLKEALLWSLLNHAIFIYDNGDKNASAKVNNEMLGISPKALEKLYNVGILWV